MAEEGLSLDVCTGGELAVAQSVGFPAERLIMHGNNKSVAELERAIDYGVGRIVIDSFDEIDRLARARAGAQRVLLRVTPGVEAHTHEYVSTGQEDQKFGFSLSSGAAAEAVHRVLQIPHLELVGMHAHIGSQIFDTAGFGLAAHRMVGLLAAVRDELGHRARRSSTSAAAWASPTPREDAPLGVAEVAARLRRDRRAGVRGGRPGGAPSQRRAGAGDQSDRAPSRSTRWAPSRSCPACAPSSRSTAA